MVAIVVPLLAVFAVSISAQSTKADLDFALIFSQEPKYKTATPIATKSVNVQAVISSIESRMSAIHSTPIVSPTKHTTTAVIKTKAKHTSTKTTKKGKTIKKPKATKKSKEEKTTTKHKPVAKKPSRVKGLVVSTVCVPQPISYSYAPSPNNATGFLADTFLGSLAAAALSPAGYTQQFTSQYGSLSATNYLGYYQLSSYNVTQCAAICSGYSGCQSFNIYFERDPSLNPGSTCPNPTSAVSVRCALWGSSISASQVINTGEWRYNFQVLIQGSNGYLANTPPPSIAAFNQPIALPGAIGMDPSTSYITSAFQAGAYIPSFCTSTCQSTTASNRAAAISARVSTYQTCNYVDAFAVTYGLNNILGTYCTLHTSPGLAIANNANLYSAAEGGVTYGITYSYAYQLSSNDTGTV